MNPNYANSQRLVSSTTCGGSPSWRLVAFAHISFSIAVFISCLALVQTGIPSCISSIIKPSYPHDAFNVILNRGAQKTTIASDGKGKVSISNSMKHMVGDYLKGKTWIVYQSDPRYAYEFDCLLPEIQQASLTRTLNRDQLSKGAPSPDNFVIAHRPEVVRL